MALGKLAEGGGSVPPFEKIEAFVTDPQLEDTHQMDRSVYLSVCRRSRRCTPKSYYPLYKVDVAGADSSSRRKKPPRICKLETDVVGKTFVTLPSGRIIGVGGESGGTLIIDTKTTPEPKVIRGPNLLAAKWDPVVAAVGSKVYALSERPSYISDPDFVPWFEVLDLSKGTVTETADGSLILEGCVWEELPCPPFCPRKLSPSDYLFPPVIVIRSYVLVLPYILVSLNEDTSCTYAFDTNSGDWHKIDDYNFLPFIGPATPHGHSGRVFLGTDLENGSINAYRIHVSTSSKVATVSGKGGALRLSVTVVSMEHKAHEQVGTIGTMEEQYIISLDCGHFCLLTFSFDTRKHSLSDYRHISKKWRGTYSRKLFAKLTTYRIEKPELLEDTEDQDEPESIAVSTLQEQDFKFSCDYGFFSPLIPFALYI